MTVVLGTCGVDGLAEVVQALRRWQVEGAPLQLHPGDLGWFWRFGAETTATAVRTWARDGELLAVGMLDGPELLRLAIAPEVQQDEELARRLAADVSDSARHVLMADNAGVEAPVGARVHQVLADNGWRAGGPWTPLHRDLAVPVRHPDVRIERVTRESVADRIAVQRAAFARSTFSEERWHTMAGGLPYADARCLVAYDEGGAAVAVVTVWSAGEGRPGLLEPMGVHPEHRGRGYGTAITVAAAAALRDLGSSSATVCTASSNVGAVATYRSAGFQPQPERCDRLLPGALG